MLTKHPQCLSPQEIAARLEDVGVQPTAQRLAIARYVLCEADHPTAEQIETAVKATLPMVSRATIYNTVRKLVEVGLLCEVKTPHSEAVRFDGNVEPHHHFIDRDTGRIYDLDFDAVEISNLDKLGRKFKIDRVSVTLEGTSKT